MHHWYQRHRRQIFLPVSLLLLPPVSTILEANNGNNYQTATNLKWTWRKKIIYMLTLLHKGAQKKLRKFFWLKIFSICHWCQRHRWCTLSWEYDRKWAWEKLIHEKNQKQKISWHCPFKQKIPGARMFCRKFFQWELTSNTPFIMALLSFLFC